MLKRYNYRAYPKPDQLEPLAQAFGCARWVYNHGLSATEAYYKAAGKSLPESTLSKQLPILKKSPETAWLSEVSAVLLQQSLHDLDRAYSNFFEGLRAKRRVGKPRFKKKAGPQSFRLVGYGKGKAFKVRKINKRWGGVTIPKVGELKFRLSRELPSTPSSVSVMLKTDGTYHVSFVVDAPAREVPASTREAGIDLGLNDFAAIVYSDGTREKIDNPRYDRASGTVKAQKNLDRKKKGSNNRNKARIRVAKQHSAVARRRQDFLDKLSTRLVSENQVIITEGMSIEGLARAGAKGARGRGMRRSVRDAGWGIFLRLIAQKARESGREHVITGKFFPSTRTCSLCGEVSERKDLSVRDWSCRCSPGLYLDRDYNAAVNELITGGHSVYGEDFRRVMASAQAHADFGEVGTSAA